MGIASYLFSETFGVYSLSNTPEVSDIGTTKSPRPKNLVKKGEVGGRLTPGDSLEPDVRGPFKDSRVDMSAFWHGFFSIPDGFEIRTGDYVQNISDSKRYFVVFFIDRMPGGAAGHHYEAKLQSTEVMKDYNLNE